MTTRTRLITVAVQVGIGLTIPAVIVADVLLAHWLGINPWLVHLTVVAGIPVTYALWVRS